MEGAESSTGTSVSTESGSAEACMTPAIEQFPEPLMSQVGNRVTLKVAAAAEAQFVKRLGLRSL